MTRQAFGNLPDEILVCLFKELTYGDLRECLTVCHSWHRRVKAHLGTSVRLRNDKDIESFLNYIEKNPEFTATVNRLDLHISSSKQKISTQMIEKLFDREFNITELRVNSAMLLVREGVQSNVFKACPTLKHICCWDKLAWSMSRQKLPKGVLKPELRFEEQSDLPVSMFKDRSHESSSGCEDDYYETHSHNEHIYNEIANGRAVFDYEFLSDLGYPRSGVSRAREHTYYGASKSYGYSPFLSVDCKSWLDLFRQQFTLETLKIELTNDRGFFSYPRQGLNEKEMKTVENLSKLESLQVQNKLFCTIPMQFISEYMTGLQELKLTQKIAFEESWTDTRLQEFYDSFSNLLSRLRSCDVHLLVRKGTVFPSTIIKDFYQQSSPYHHRSKRIFELSVGMFDETITLISEKYGNEKVQRLVTIEFDRENSLDILVNSIISTLKINAFRFSRYGPNFPDDYVLAFQSTLDNLPDATEVSYYVSGTKFTCEQVPWKQYPQVTHLELYSTNKAVDFPPSGSDLTRVFKNIASLKLNYTRLCRDFYLKDLKLKRLYLDISRMWYDVQRSVARAPRFLALDITSKGRRHFYKMSMEGLNVTKTGELEYSDFQIHIQTEEVQFITLYLDSSFPEFDYLEYYQRKNGSEINICITP